jgi:glycogen(starch) synthase
MHDLALGLAENGCEVEVVSLSAGQTSSSCVYHGVTIHTVAPSADLNHLQQFLTVMPYSHSVLKQLCALYDRFLSLHAERAFDVVEAPEMFGEGLFIALAKIAPLVVRLHTPHFKFIDQKLHSIDEGFDHQFLALIEKAAIMQADAVTCPSEDLAQFVARKTGYPLAAISILRNHVDTDLFKPEQQRLLEPPQGATPVLFAGRLEERKGVYVLAKAIPSIIKKFPAVHFFLVGNDTNTADDGMSVRDLLTQQLVDCGCLNYVSFTGAVPHLQMPSVYNSAAICVLPSLYENAPIVCIEAMACGVPVIVSSAGGTKEYVEDGVTGLIVPPADSDSLANAITTLLCDSGLRSSLGSAARKKAVDEYDRRLSARKTAALYEQACKQYAQRKEFALLKMDGAGQVPALYELLQRFDNMLYQHIYRHSFVFRLKYCWHMLRARPKLGAITLLLSMVNQAACLLRLRKAKKFVKQMSLRLGADRQVLFQSKPD